MENVIRDTITVTTDANGVGVGYSTKRLTGFIRRIRYLVNTEGVPLAAEADVTITAHDSGASILTITNQAQSSADYAPMQATHSTAGAAALYAAGGTAVNAPIPLANERVKVSVAQGGDTKSGQYLVWVG